MTTINTMEDLMRVLDENPEWREAVRTRVLTRELLELPEKFAQHRAEFIQLRDEFAQHRAEFLKLSDEFAQHRAEFLKLSDEFAQHRAEFVKLSNDFVKLSDEFTQHRAEFLKLSDEFAHHRAEFIEHRREMRRDLAQVKAGHALYMSSRMGPHFAQELGLRYRRKVEPEELAAMTHNRTELTRAQRKSFNLSDLIFVAAAEDGDERYVVVEVSYTANGRDSTRALEHAGMLTRYTGLPALAAVAATRYDNDLQPLLDSGRLHWLELEVRDLEPE